MSILKKRKNESRRIIIAALVGFCAVLSFVAQASAGVQKAGVKCRVEIDRAILPAGGNQRAVVKVTLDAPPPPEKSTRPAVNLAIVLDRSGSMSGQKLERAKDAAIEALRHLGPMDIFSVVVYDHNVSTVVSAQHAKNIEWIEGRIRQIRSGGNTALFGGVSQGAAEVRKNLDGNYVNRIILLSDGLANVGPSSPEDLGRLGVALIKESISVTTIGVGTDYNEDLMTSLSQKSDGNTYFVESSRDLPRIFTAELGDVLSVVAKKVHVIIECPGGVKPLKIIGREGRIKGRIVEFSLNQLYGSQEKYALIEVEISGGKSGEKKDIAYVNVSYENPFTQKKETSSGRGYTMFSKDKIKVKKSANIAVQREYNFNLNALSQEKAISLSDKGKNEEAVSELKKSAQKLREVGQEHNDEELLKRAEEMEVQAGQIEKEGMTKKYRKMLRTDSYQMKNQQMSK
ncbi:MAG: VWA domain-containing protein [Deltaproteobacteria bacterium]|jgi:Ca-activated chloride channel family protein|nr:VWA domain-containing protein [Deltaproteobacteria bacterium]MDL1989111.1 VWA domain-containing protein [Deltaproteobacteria bacterium]